MSETPKGRRRSHGQTTKGTTKQQPPPAPPLPTEAELYELDGCCYLLCFHRDGVPCRHFHAGHYLGHAAPDHLAARLEQHRKGQGARLTQVVVEAGFELVLARTWPGTRQRERKLKNWHKSNELCPICNPRCRLAR